MAVNNLRVIYQNLADLSATTITASTTAGVTSAANLQKDAKALIWRSGTNSATLTVNFGGAKIVRGVVLPFTNLLTTSTINVTATVNAGSFVPGTTYTIASSGNTNFTAIGAANNVANTTFTATGTGSSSTTGTATYTTGSILACPYAQTDNWDPLYLPQGANSYAYGSGTYARAWFPVAQNCTSLSITLNDTNLSYIEASRLVVGDYWSPTYNTSFGLVSAPKSLSTNSRTESGDLVTNRGIQYNTMSFDLTWLTPSDRAVFTKILKSNGINKPLLISLFPDQTSEDYDKEQTFQIYGKLTQMPDLTHPMFSMYSSKIEIEEI